MFLVNQVEVCVCLIAGSNHVEAILWSNFCVYLCWWKFHHVGLCVMTEDYMNWHLPVYYNMCLMDHQQTMVRLPAHWMGHPQMMGPMKTRQDRFWTTRINHFHSCMWYKLLTTLQFHKIMHILHCDVMGVMRRYIIIRTVLVIVPYAPHNWNM